MRRMVASRTLAVLGIVWLSLAGTGWAQGFVVIAGDDADEAAGGHCRGTLCGGLFKNLFNKAFQYSNIKTNRILAIGVNSSEVLSAFDNWNFLGPVGVVTHARTTAEIASAVFSDYQLVYIPSSFNQTAGGITAVQIAALNARQPDLAHYVNNLGGALIALTEAGATGAWGWLPVPLTTLNQTFGSVDITPALTALSPTTTSTPSPLRPRVRRLPRCDTPGTLSVVRRAIVFNTSCAMVTRPVDSAMVMLLYCITIPPSTDKVCPVMNAASSEARKATA